MLRIVLKHSLGGSNMQMFVHEAHWFGMEASKCLDHTARLFRSHFSCRVALTAEEPVCCGLVAGSTVLLLLASLVLRLVFLPLRFTSKRRLSETH